MIIGLIDVDNFRRAKVKGVKLYPTWPYVKLHRTTSREVISLSGHRSLNITILFTGRKCSALQVT